MRARESAISGMACHDRYNGIALHDTLRNDGDVPHAHCNVEIFAGLAVQVSIGQERAPSAWSQ